MNVLVQVSALAVVLVPGWFLGRVGLALVPPKDPSVRRVWLAIPLVIVVGGTLLAFLGLGWITWTAWSLYTLLGVVLLGAAVVDRVRRRRLAKAAARDRHPSGGGPVMW